MHAGHTQTARKNFSCVFENALYNLVQPERKEDKLTTKTTYNLAAQARTDVPARLWWWNRRF